MDHEKRLLLRDVQAANVTAPAERRSDRLTAALAAWRQTFFRNDESWADCFDGVVEAALASRPTTA
ncbi:MAG: hypothetical protein V3T70_09190 [Phycisphaerae bacterium]